MMSSKTSNLLILISSLKRFLERFLTIRDSVEVFKELWCAKFLVEMYSVICKDTILNQTHRVGNISHLRLDTHVTLKNKVNSFDSTVHNIILRVRYDFTDEN